MSLVMGWAISGLLQSSVSLAGSAGFPEVLLSTLDALIRWCQNSLSFFKVGRKKHFLLLCCHGVQLWKASITAELQLCSLSGLWEPEGRSLSYCSAQCHSLSLNSKICILKLSSVMTSTARKQARHPTTMSVKLPLKLTCDTISRTSSYA